MVFLYTGNVVQLMLSHTKPKKDVCWYTIWFLPTQRYASAGLCDNIVSVCLSITSQYCIMISSPSGSHTILVFWCQISSQNSIWVTPSWGVKQGRVGKIRSFLSLSLNISKTVADTAKVTING